ncbi:phage tail assembly chaperone [Comamonas sp. UBA7528]|uniref:phage tail assembly chaperone n=1 Tax=Comamonas sp. UBA7528 TaxID=1946391 RepID=UPI0025C306B8|nr:phage tail assembly chaperone [Comamonas sp. UBA7528]
MEFSFAGLVSNGVNEAAGLILKAVTAWDMEDAMTVENIVELEDILPGTISATLNKIDGALFQGRLGN